MSYPTIAAIKAANAAAGQFFFSPDTMRFFRSKIESRSVIGGRYFITSEQFDFRSPRLYTVRRANDDATIDTVGEFQQYDSFRAAQVAARAAAEAEVKS